MARTAVDAARQRVAAAERWIVSARQNLQSAGQELEDAKEQLRALESDNALAPLKEEGAVHKLETDSEDDRFSEVSVEDAGGVEQRAVKQDPSIDSNEAVPIKSEPGVTDGEVVGATSESGARDGEVEEETGDAREVTNARDTSSSSVDVKQELSRKRMRISTDDELSNNQPAGISTTDEAAKLWCDKVKHHGINFYRIRVFQCDSKKTKGDNFGRKCSFWCIKNEFIPSSALMLKALPIPEEMQRNGEACKSLIRELSHEELKDLCRKCEEYYSVEGNKFTRTYKYFVEMKPGDVVAMHVKGNKAKNDPLPQTLVFGVVQDDSLILMGKDEARREHGFPWDFKRDKNVSSHVNYTEKSFCNGIMLRKVKWYRQGTSQEVRGDDQAKWLLECVPIWLVNLEGRRNAAIKEMTDRHFLENTKVIDEAWVEKGLTGL